jgi:hypothetical protein
MPKSQSPFRTAHSARSTPKSSSSIVVTELDFLPPPCFLWLFLFPILHCTEPQHHALPLQGPPGTGPALLLKKTASGSGGRVCEVRLNSRGAWGGAGPDRGPMRPKAKQKDPAHRKNEARTHPERGHVPCLVACAVCFLFCAFYPNSCILVLASSLVHLSRGPPRGGKQGPGRDWPVW